MHMHSYVHVHIGIVTITYITYSIYIRMVRSRLSSLKCAGTIDGTTGYTHRTAHTVYFWFHVLKCKRLLGTLICWLQYVSAAFSLLCFSLFSFL